MVVRVRVKLKSVKGEVITAALANSGFETEEPEVILPIKIAERLGIYPKLPAGSEVEQYKGVGGIVVKVFVVKEIVNVSVLTSDREVGPSSTTAVITPREDEVILSDKLMDTLKIILLRPGEGVWKFTDDREDVSRRSEPPEKW